MTRFSLLLFYCEVIHNEQKKKKTPFSLLDILFCTSNKIHYLYFEKANIVFFLFFHHRVVNYSISVVIAGLNTSGSDEFSDFVGRITI